MKLRRGLLAMRSFKRAVQLEKQPGRDYMLHMESLEGNLVNRMDELILEMNWRQKDPEVSKELEELMRISCYSRRSVCLF